MRKGSRLLVCPSCALRGVYAKRDREDWWVCRYCQWSTCMHGEDQVDRYHRNRLAKLNPQSGVGERPLRLTSSRA